jgi:hypothetical protein
MANDQITELLEAALGANAGDAEAVQQWFAWVLPMMGVEAKNAPQAAQELTDLVLPKTRTSSNVDSGSSKPATSNNVDSSETGDLAQLATQLQRTLAEAPQNVSQSSKKSSSQSSDSGTSVGSVVGQVLSHTLSSGFGLASLVSGIVGLFGSKPEEPAPLVHFALPTAVHVEAGLSERTQQFSSLSYSQDGLARSAQPQVPSVVSSAMAPPQLVDSQWFMDHSSQIAQAVRDAMLNSTSLNDVVTDL